MLRGSRGIRHHRFDVGAHHRPDPRLARIAPELIGRAAATAQAFAQPLHRHVESSLPAIAETVDDRSAWIGDGDIDAVDAMTCDALGQKPPAEAHEPNARIVDLRPPGGALD